MLEAQSAMMRAALGSEVSLAKDSAEAVQRCGAVPPRPAFMATEDSLAARATELADRRRESELEAQARVAERSGMTSTRFAMARERLERWYVVSTKGGPRFWGEAEGALLERNRDRIARVLTALGVRA